MFMVLHYGIGDRSQHQNSQQDVQFILQTYEGAVGEGDDKTERLPHTVVGKRCLFVPGEEDTVKSCKTEGKGPTEIKSRCLSSVIITILNNHD